MAARDGASYRLSAAPAIMLAQLFGAAAVTLVLVWLLHFRKGLSLTSDDKQRLFNVHPFLMLLGLIYFAGQGIMAFKMVTGTRKVRKFVHMALHLIAICLGALGLFAIIKFHRDLGIAQFYTLHSWLGIATISLFVLQWVVAFFSFWFPGAQMPARANLVPWHAFFGVVIFLMAICTAEMGLLERFRILGLFRDAEAYVVNFTGVAVLLFGITVILSVILPRGYY